MSFQMIFLKQSDFPSKGEKELWLLLSAEEQAALEKIHDVSRRQLKLHTHARLRQEAARLLRVHPKDLLFDIGE
ncbi:MAG: hypothetical protein MR355_06240, partial [Lachnospiraceae bacterium]|nr:hypothetical protein [Lachnospiraceae bacterium]